MSCKRGHKIAQTKAKGLFITPKLVELIFFIVGTLFIRKIKVGKLKKYFKSEHFR